MSEIGKVVEMPKRDAYREQPYRKDRTYFWLGISIAGLPFAFFGLVHGYNWSVFLLSIGGICCALKALKEVNR